MKPLPSRRRKTNYRRFLLPLALLGVAGAGYLYRGKLSTAYTDYANSTLVAQGEFCHVTLTPEWEELFAINGGDEVEFGFEHVQREIGLTVSAVDKAVAKATTLREAEGNWALAWGSRVGACQVLKQPRNVRSLAQTGIERVIRYSEDGHDRTAILAAYQSSSHYFRVFCECPSELFDSNRELMHGVTRSFRLGKPGDYGVDIQLPQLPTSDASTPELPPVDKTPYTNDSYAKFLARLRETHDLDERVVMLRDWKGRKLDGIDGSWRDLVLALAEGPTDQDIDALVIGELKQARLSMGELVACLPKASLRVRRELTARLVEAPPEDRAFFIEFLSDSPSQDSAGILEAFLLLGEITPERVSQLVVREGLELVKDRTLRSTLLEHARTNVPFVQALSGDPEPRVRSFACTLAGRAGAAGDDSLNLLVARLRDPDPSVRIAAIKALTTLKNPRSVWGLARAAAREGGSTVGEQALLALASFGPPRTLPFLVSLLKREQLDDQYAALVALRALPASTVREPLAAALGSRNPILMRAALGTVIHLGEREGSSAIQPFAAQVRDVHVWSDVELANLKSRALVLLE